jgi:hypothetical protein
MPTSVDARELPGAALTPKGNPTIRVRLSAVKIAERASGG